MIIKMETKRHFFSYKEAYLSGGRNWRLLSTYHVPDPLHELSNLLMARGNIER